MPEETVQKYRPTPTWFFVKSDNFELSRDTTNAELLKAHDNGDIFNLEEVSAARVLDPNKSSWQRQDVRLIGYSDCTQLYRHMKEGKMANAEVEARNKILSEQKLAIVDKERYLLRGDTLSDEDIAIVRKPFEGTKPERELLVSLYNEAIVKEIRIAIENKKAGGYPLPVFQHVFTPNASPNTRATLLRELNQTA